MGRRTSAMSIGVLVVLFIAAMASARILWVPIAGPMFKKAQKQYETLKAPLVSPTGGPASGTVKLDCNGGDDADRLVVKATELPKGVKCRVWFTDRAGKRMGEPFETSADDDGRLHFTVFGALCYVKDFPILAVTVNDKVALTAELKRAVPSAVPSAAPAPSASAEPEE